MSYTVSIVVRCDGQQHIAGLYPRDIPCTRLLTFQVHDRGGLSATFAAYKAEQAGWWARSSGEHNSTPVIAFCPDHWPTDGKQAGATARSTKRMREHAAEGMKPKEKQP